MKKTLIAAAVLAGFAGVAQAASTVTLYGNLDGGLQYSKVVTKADSKTTTTSFGITQNAMSGNKFGLKGSEDLGNGVSAIFKLEGGFNITDGSIGAVKEDDKVVGSSLFGKHTYLGLSSDAFGTLTAGNDDDAVGQLLTDNALGGHFGFGDITLIPGNTSNDDPLMTLDFFGAIAGDSVQPGLVYVTPDLSGAQFAVSWQGTHSKTKTDKTAKTSNNGFSLAGAYSAGPLAVSGGVRFTNTHEIKDSKDSAKTKDFTWVVGGNYDFGVVNVFARVGGESGKDLMTKQKDPKKLAWSLGLAAPVSSTGTVAFEYQGTKVKVFGEKNKVTSKYNGMTFKLGYLEAMSKNTTAFAYAGYAHTKDKVSKSKVNATLVGFGLNHSF